MILYRYLAKEIYTALLAVTVVLVLVFLSNTIVHYLHYAASGRIAASVIVRLIFLQLPYLLGLMLPIGLFFGILLALGRLYIDGEITVLFACGLSGWQLLVKVFMISVVVVFLIAMLTMWVNPLIAARKDRLVSQEAPENALLQTLIPGRFMTSSDGRRVFYVEDVGRDHLEASDLFIAEMPEEGAVNQVWTVVAAKSGHQSTNLTSGSQFIVAKEGYRYQGVPGQKDFVIIKFSTYGAKIDQVAAGMTRLQEDAKPMSTLFLSHELDDIAELQWRISIPLAALVFIFLGVPLSRVQPRQGRYVQLLPAIVISMVYVNLLFMARAWLERGMLPVGLGLWWVHLLFAVLAFVLYRRRHGFHQKRMRKR